MMEKLPRETIQLISSSQVITSVYSAVKELFENSIDAKSTSIEVRLENFGLQKIEVVDNGTGIKAGEEELVAKSHYTSKLREHSELMSVSSLGFRGEAIHSLCTVSNLSFSTKTEEQIIGKLFTIDFEGNIIDWKPYSRENGVTMTVVNLFRNLPVRKHFYSCVKKRKEELKRIEDLLVSFALIKPQLRIVLKHNKSIVWQKSATGTIKDCFISVFGVNCFEKMCFGSITDESKSLTVEYIIPRKDADENIFRTSSDKIFVSVNERPIKMKIFNQVLKSIYSEFFNNLSSKYPIAFIALSIPTQKVDINIEPNKTAVLLENQDQIIEIIKKIVRSIFGDEKEADNTAFIKSAACHLTASNSPNKSAAITVAHGDNFGFESTFLTDADAATGLIADKPLAQVSMPHTSPRVDCYFPNTPEFSDIERHKVNISDLENHQKQVLPAKRIRFSFTEDGTDKKQSEDVDSNNVTNVESLSKCIEQNEIASNNVARAGHTELQTRVTSELTCSVSDETEEIREHSSVGNDIRNVLVNSIAGGDHNESSSLCLFSQETEQNDCVLSEFAEVEKITKQTLKPSQDEITNNCLEKRECDEIDSSSENENLDEFFDRDVDIFGCKQSGNQSPQVNLTQISIDGWSRGIGIKEKNSGEIQPFRILQPQNAPTKRDVNKMPAFVDTKIHFKNSALSPGLNHNLSHEVHLPFLFDDVKHHFNDISLSESEQKDTFDEKQKSNNGTPFKIGVIGTVRPWNSWIISIDNELYFFNPYRSREVLIFRKLMNKHVLPTAACNFSLNERILCKRQLEQLQKLRFEILPPEAGRFLVDERITSNGFEIRQRKDVESEELVFEIIKQPRAIEKCGAQELGEIIDKILNVSTADVNEYTSMEHFRPKKVTEFLQAEAIRLSRSAGINFTKEDIIALLEEISVDEAIKGKHICLHGKPFLSPCNFKK